MTAVLFYSSNRGSTFTAIWSGWDARPGATLHADSVYAYIAGSHLPVDSMGYKSLTRVEPVSGYPTTELSPAAPLVTILGGKYAHYLDESGASLGGAYIEVTASGIVTTSGNLLYNPSYPESADGWFASSGGPGGSAQIGYPMNDLIGLDYPDNPRILISTRTITNYSGSAGGPGVMVVNLPSGAETDYRYWTTYNINVPSGIWILDIETHKVLG